MNRIFRDLLGRNTRSSLLQFAAALSVAIRRLRHGPQLYRNLNSRAILGTPLYAKSRAAKLRPFPLALSRDLEALLGTDGDCQEIEDARMPKVKLAEFEGKRRQQDNPITAFPAIDDACRLERPRSLEVPSRLRPGSRRNAPRLPQLICRSSHGRLHFDGSRFPCHR